MIVASEKKYTPLIMLFISAIIATATVSVHPIALLIGAWAFSYGLFKTVKNRNRNEEALLYAAFIVGAEIYFRMSFVGLPWEFGKIAVIILLLTGLFVEKKKKTFPLIMLLYILLLLPAFFVRDWDSLVQLKHDVMFNMSGQFSLIVAVFYCYKRNISDESLIQIGRVIIYGIFLMAIMVLVKSPYYGSIDYGGGSNFEASGGFGPNQVSVIFGLGIFIMGFFLIQNKHLFTSKSIDILLLIMFTLQGLFTLSRGGVIAGMVALIVGILALYFSNPKQVNKVLKINPLKIGLITVVLIGAFWQGDAISGGSIQKRYFNQDEYGNQIKEDYSTHRGEIVNIDFNTFLENWETGTGVGGSAFFRNAEAGISAVHVEFSRILADHGILGLVALIIMLFFPIFIFFNLKDIKSKFLLSAFVALSLLTMSHNAMRLAVPGFFYGFGFMLVYVNNITQR